MPTEIVLIENWSVVVHAEDPAPALIYFHGNLWGHPNQPDGMEATTSEILGYDEENQVFVCRSRWYRLGTIDPEWVKQHPEVSLEKVIENLPKM